MSDGGGVNGAIDQPKDSHAGEDARADGVPAPPPPCPECLAGKHGNCSGFTWNDDTDERDVCPCSDAGH
jgi:hypothetical protein